MVLGENLIKNPTLSDLVTTHQSNHPRVERGRTTALPKDGLERKAPPRLRWKCWAAALGCMHMRRCWEL